MEISPAATAPRLRPGARPAGRPLPPKSRRLLDRSLSETPPTLDPGGTTYPPRDGAATKDFSYGWKILKET